MQLKNFLKPNKFCLTFVEAPQRRSHARRCLNSFEKLGQFFFDLIKHLDLIFTREFLHTTDASLFS